MTEVAPARFGAVEAGGTKFVCLLGSSPDDIEARTRIPTGADPEATLAEVVAFFAGSPPPAAVGIASFGPVELRPGHPQYGHITSTPKPGWRDADLVGPIRAALGVPIGFDTDVAGAALGEGRWGAAQGLSTFVYMTVGTGIGAAAVVGGRPASGLGHAEMGHIAVPRQDGDRYPGRCPYHGDCLEGMAAGGAIAERFGRPGEQLDGDDLRQAVAVAGRLPGRGAAHDRLHGRAGAHRDRRQRRRATRAVPPGAGRSSSRRWPATAPCPSTRRTTSWCRRGWAAWPVRPERWCWPRTPCWPRMSSPPRERPRTADARPARPRPGGRRRRPARRAGRRLARGRRGRAAVLAGGRRRLRHRLDHHRRPVPGHRAGAARRCDGGLLVLRQGRAVVGSPPGVPVRAGGDAGVRAGLGAVRGRAPGLPQRPGRPAAAGADHAAGVRRRRPRRRVHRALARGRPGRRRTLGPHRARPGRAPARPARGEPAGPAAGHGRRPRAAPQPAHLRRGPGGPARRPRAARRRPLAPPRRGPRVRRRAAPRPRRRRRHAVRGRRRAGGPPPRHRPRRRLHPQPARRRGPPGAGTDRLRVLGPGSARVRPGPADHGRGPARRTSRRGAARRRAGVPRRVRRGSTRGGLRRRRRGGRAASTRPPPHAQNAEEGPRRLAAPPALVVLLQITCSRRRPAADTRCRPCATSA